MFKEIFDLNRLSTLLLFRSILFFIFTFYGFSKIKTVKFIFVIAFIIIIQSVSYSQWISQSVPVDKPFIGLEFVNENTGWAITENTSLTDTAYILNSTNGGTNWNVQYRGNIGIQSMDAINTNICYAGGVDTNGDALFLKTSNGGHSWLVNNIGANKVADDMFFLNKDTGYICDNFSGGVYLTTDAGTSWINRQSGIFAFPKTLYFLNFDTGFCGGSFKLFKTTNAGMNWGEIFSFGSLGNRDIFALQFLNNEMGWAGLSGMRVGITTNGGLNWNLSRPNPIGGENIPSIVYKSDSILWAGSGQRIIYKSTNNGYNWIIQIDSGGSYSMDFRNNLTGWSGYGYNNISKTTNGGLTYLSGTNSEIPVSFNLYQNYPNPFNPSTNIKFTITQVSNVVISIFDILGREIFRWKSDGSIQSGTYEYKFMNENLSGGVYIYKLTARSVSGNSIFTDSKKMIYIK